MELAPAGSPLVKRSHHTDSSGEALDELLIDVPPEVHRKASREILPDLDATHTPLHGAQVARFSHGYYNNYCYLPVYIFWGEHLRCAQLRPWNLDVSAGSLEEGERIVQQIRKRRPRVHIFLRAESGFCCEELMD